MKSNWLIYWLIELYDFDSLLSLRYNMENSSVLWISDTNRIYNCRTTADMNWKCLPFTYSLPLSFSSFTNTTQILSLVSSTVLYNLISNILVCNFHMMIFAAAACGSVFLCLLLVSDDSPLIEPSESTVARVAVGKFVATLCQAFVPVRCVWRRMGGGSLASRCPSSSSSGPQKTTMIRGGWVYRGMGMGGVVVWKSSSDSQLCRARAIQYVPKNPPQWRPSRGKRCAVSTSVVSGI